MGGQEQEGPRQPKSMTTDLEFECLIYIMEHGLEIEL